MVIFVGVKHCICIIIIIILFSSIHVHVSLLTFFHPFYGAQYSRTKIQTNENYTIYCEMCDR